jgi:cysteine desulfurase
MNEPVYLDSHSATKALPEVLDLFMRSSKEYWGAFSSPHFVGQQQIYPMQKAIGDVSKVLGVSEESIVFNHGGAEGLQQAVMDTYLNVTRETGKTLFLHIETEEVSSVETFKQLESLGCMIKPIPLNEKGQVTREALLSAITPKTAMLSLPWVNGLTGVIQPVSDLAEVCKEKGILFHLDASYMIGKRFFRFQDMNVDFLTVDGALIHGIPESGIMLVKKNIPSSLQSVSSISAIAYAISEMEVKFEHYCMEIARLRDLLEEGVMEGCQGAEVLHKDADRVPNCSSITFPGVYAESLLYLLNARGVYATIGGGRFQSLEKTEGFSAISFSLSFETTEEEIERVVAEVVSCATHLQNVSREAFL